MPAPTADPAASFVGLYETYFPFVWRTLWRLGVRPASVADAAQDVFVVVHRRLADLHGSEVAQSWLYGIVVRVARDYRRGQARRDVWAELNPELTADSKIVLADRQYEQREAVELLDQLLDELEDAQRELLVLIELEQMSVPEVSELLGINPNTLYTRLRAARKAFDQVHIRHRARERRQP